MPNLIIDPPANLTIRQEEGSLHELMVAGARRRELVVLAREGERKRLICTTGAYYPHVMIKWLLQETTGGHAGLARPPRQLNASRTTETATPDGESFVQESQVQLVIRRELDRSYVECQAWDETEHRIDTRVRLDIICKKNHNLLFCLLY
ncbi:unnamed protein product [Protopolystoma xenopodis]|uniref:Ig-like domain-containing protein n=1 Tax=Protopolystoma xenopodis TaxID=117903 RepID=A0A448WGM3_9PLAT|nr:unnamed protein product [Protopolystoma xenopodis]